MNAILRHLSLRLWITAIAGGLVSVVVLPWWQRFFGLGGLLIPVFMLLAACFVLAGWTLDKLGLAFIKRIINEASVWERAGMTAEAEAAFQRAIAIFDSFWFSPLQRRRRIPWFTARLARFYLGRSNRNAYAHAMVRGYLLKFPADSEVAVAWLEQLLNRRQHSSDDHEAVARIGDALSDHAEGQQMLMEFHLANGRVDFQAMQTYHRVWRRLQPLPDALLIPLADLLLQEGWMSHWALRIYIDALKRDHQPALAGIAGCACWMHQTLENRQDLASAKNILAQCDTEQVTDLAKRFKPLQPTKTDAKTDRSASVRTRQRINAMGSGMSIATDRTVTVLGAVAQKIGHVTSKLKFTRRTAVGVAVVVAVLVVLNVGRQMIRTPAETPQPLAPSEPVPEVKDPFTIQVAAYLKSEDAQVFVDQLKQQGLDAFWTEATSANRKWYQVKVSHFGTKELARQYGQELKSKGLIDDYYVANFGQK